MPSEEIKKTETPEVIPMSELKEKMEELKEKAEEAGAVVEGELPTPNPFQDLNYVQLEAKRRDLRRSLDQAAASNDTIDTILEFYNTTLKDDNPVVRDAIQKSLEDADPQVKKLIADPDSYRKEFQTYVEGLSRDLALVEDVIGTKYADHETGVTFYDKESIEAYEMSIATLKKNIESLDKVLGSSRRKSILESELERTQKKLNAVKDRVTLNYWMGKMNHPGSVKKAEKDTRGDFVASAQYLKKRITALIPQQKDTIYDYIFAFLTGLCGDPVAVHVMMHYIVHLYDVKKGTGEETNSTVLLTSIISVMTMNWDYKDVNMKTLLMVLLGSIRKHMSKETYTMYNRSKQKKIDNELLQEIDRKLQEATAQKEQEKPSEESTETASE